MNKLDVNRIIRDKSGFSYIKVTPEEVASFGGYHMCCACNNQYIDRPLNLCFILEDLFCDDCMKEVIKRWEETPREYLEEDLAIEETEALDWYKSHLEVKTKSDPIVDYYNAFYGIDSKTKLLKK